jgi:hypothetical protein
MTPLPTQQDLTISPELAILAALRVSLQLVSDTLRIVQPVDHPPDYRDPDVLSAATIIHLAEALRIAVVDYEQRMAGLHRAG